MTPAEMRTAVRYAVFGLGAIGGQIAARLAAAGADVCGVARGATLDAIRSRGIEIRHPGEEPRRQRIEVADNLADLGAADCVILGIKATALGTIIDELASIDSNATVLTAMNGIPWWFFDGFGDSPVACRPPSVDPAGQLAALIPSERVIGAAVHTTGSVLAPGVVSCPAGGALKIGAAGSEGPAVSALPRVSTDLTLAGYEVETSDNIRLSIWYKLWGNLSLNPVSMLTRSPVDAILADPLARKFVMQCMTEADLIGKRINLGIEQPASERLTLTEKLGSFKPSMLQDAEVGRMVELDALLSSVKEIGTLTGVATPAIDALLGLSRVHARAHGLYL